MKNVTKLIARLRIASWSKAYCIWALCFFIVISYNRLRLLFRNLAKQKTCYYNYHMRIIKIKILLMDFFFSFTKYSLLVFEMLTLKLLWEENSALHFKTTQENGNWLNGNKLFLASVFDFFKGRSGCLEIEPRYFWKTYLKLRRCSDISKIIDAFWEDFWPRSINSEWTSKRRFLAKRDWNLRL